MSVLKTDFKDWRESSVVKDTYSSRGPGFCSQSLITQALKASGVSGLCRCLHSHAYIPTHKYNKNNENKSLKPDFEVS